MDNGMKKRTSHKRRLLGGLLCACLLVTFAGRPVMDTAFALPLGQGSTDFGDAEDADAAVDEEDDEASESSSSQNTTADDARSQISQINQSIKALQDKEKEVTAQLGSVQKDKNEKIQEMAGYQNQIELADQQIELLEEQIAYYEALIKENDQKIADKEEEIANKEQEIADNTELLKKRVRAYYMAGNPTALEVALGSGSYFSMLSSVEMMNRMIDHDERLLENLSVERENLEQQRLELEEIKAQQEQDKWENEAAKEEQDKLKEQLARQKEDLSQQVQTLADTEKAFYANMEQIKKQMEEAQEELAAVYAQLQAATTLADYVGGEFGWPLPGYTMITSEFGSRFGGSDYHTGMDISGASVYGKPVVAANDGVVAFVNTNYTPGVGYGIYVIVDHGGGYTTLYAHLSKIIVSVGQPVVRGQKIAEVGSTGWSTGPHLHFEVRVNGTAQNPRGYLF